MNSSIKALSLNINGCYNKEKALDDLLQLYDVLFIQEHMLSGSNSNFLNRSKSNELFILPAKFTAGRPSGGFATYTRTNYQQSCQLKTITCPFLLCFCYKCIYAN